MPRGEWVNPVPPSVIQDKARDLLGLVVDASAAEALVSRVMSIEKVADARTMVPELERQSTPARTGAAQTADIR